MRNSTWVWPDKVFLGIVILLLLTGIFVFTSASFGLSNEQNTWENVLFSQLVLGLGVGLVLGFAATFIPRGLVRNFAFYLIVIAIVANCLLYIPGLGFEAGGATRWIHVFGVSFQPSELLKIALVVFLASWLSRLKNDVRDLRYGLIPFILTIAVVGALMLSQPDTGTFMVMFASAIVVYFCAGARKSHLGGLLLAGVVVLVILVLTRPYVRSRITVFLDPEHDPSGEAYQIQQSLMAVGSGGLTGRGFGQSMQKFSYLPEPMGDSIFAVLAEEFGFVGSSIVILLFVGYCLRGLRIASLANSSFDRLLVTGLVIITTTQAFMHIGATLGLLPFTGIPLPFVSHGGTALMFALIGSGLILNVSRSEQN